jgi:hypothetical protein
MWKDYAESIGTTAAALTKQQKIQAEVNGILEETRFQTGDAAKLSGQYSGLVAALGTSFYNLKVAVGNTIIPILTAIIPVVKSVVDWLVILFNHFAQVMNALFGVKLGMDKIADSTKEAADAADKQADAAKKALGALAAFDEINVLQVDKEGAPPGTEPPTIPPPDTEPVESGLDQLKEKIAQFMADLKDLFQPAIDAFGRLKEALIPLGETIWEGLKWAWDNILVPLGEWVITDLLPVFLDLLAAAIETLNIAIEALKPLGLWIFDEFLKPIAEWSGDAILDFLGWLTDKLKDLGVWIEANPESFQRFTGIIIAFFAAWKITNFIADIGLFLINLIKATVSIIANTVALAANTIAWIANKIAVAALALLYAGQFLAHLALSAIRIAAETVAWIASTIAKIANKIVTAALALLYAGRFLVDLALSAVRIAAETVVLVASTIAKGAATVVQLAFNVAVAAWNIIGAVATIVTTGFGIAVGILTSPITLVILAIVALVLIIIYLILHWEDVKRIARETWDKIKEKWGEAKEWFRTSVLDPLVEKFATAWVRIQDGATTAFDSIKEIAKSAINVVIGILNGMISAVVGGINTVLSALNSIQVDIPGILGGGHIGFSIPLIVAPQIPLLATGAVIPPNAAFAAVLGDQRAGKNIESPESLLRQIVREESQQQGAQAVTVRFEGSLAPIVRLMNPVIEQERTRVGGSLLQGGARA